MSYIYIYIHINYTSTKLTLNVASFENPLGGRGIHVNSRNGRFASTWRVTRKR